MGGKFLSQKCQNSSHVLSLEQDIHYRQKNKNKKVKEQFIVWVSFFPLLNQNDLSILSYKPKCIMYLAGLLDLQLWSYQLLGNKGKQKTKPLLRSASFNNGKPTCMSTALQGRPHAGSNGSIQAGVQGNRGVKLAGWGGERGEDLGGVGGRGINIILKTMKLSKH